MKRAILQDILKKCHHQLQLGTHPQKDNFIHWTFLVKDGRIISSGVNRPVEPAKHFGYHRDIAEEFGREGTPSLKNSTSSGHSPTSSIGNHATKYSLKGLKEKNFFPFPSSEMGIDTEKSKLGRNRISNIEATPPGYVRKGKCGCGNVGGEGAFPAKFTRLIPKLHSELDCLRRCRENPRGAIAINVRLNKTGQERLSAPCATCYKLLWANNTKKVFFTTNVGWAELCIN